MAQLMLQVSLVILHTMVVLATEAYAQGLVANEAGNGFIDRLSDRPMDKLFVNRAALDDTTLSKSAHLSTLGTISRQIQSLPRPSSHARPRDSSMIHRRAPSMRNARPRAADSDDQDLSSIGNTMNLFAKSKPVEEDQPLRVWPDRYKSLVDRGLQCITSFQAVKMVEEEGAVFVDVRPQEIFDGETIEGAINVPLFRPVTGGSFFDNLKRAVPAVAGIKSREKNPDFAQIALDTLPQDNPLIIFCDRGGLLELPGIKEGEKIFVGDTEFGKFKEFTEGDRYTLSLKAAYELYEAGFKKLYYLKGGLTQWRLDPD